MDIRKACPTDLEPIKLCIEAAYKKYVDSINDMPSMTEGMLEDIVSNHVWIAEEDSKIIGCLFLIKAPDHMKLANLAVHPDCSDKGIGRKLIEFAESQTHAAGFRELRLNTHAAMPKNIQIYIHLGWREIARHGNTVSMTKEI